MSPSHSAQRKSSSAFKGSCAESPVEGRPGTLAGKALAPDVGMQPPADLDAGADGKIARRHPGESDHPRQSAVRTPFRSPEAKALQIDPGIDPVDQGVARLGRNGAAQPVMDPGIAVDRRKGRTVGICPSSEDQSVGDNHAGRGAVRAP